MAIETFFITSSFCPAGSCVEAGVRPDGDIAVRDTKDRSKPEHVFTRSEWDAFVAGVKNGEFDFPAAPLDALV